MQKHLTNCVLFSLLLLAFASCRPSRNLVYFSDLNNSENYQTKVQNEAALRIQPDDLLSIRLNSLSQESNALFNRGILQAPGTSTTNLTPEVVTPSDGYLVDPEGNIDFPVLGKVMLAGLTREEATVKITNAVAKYVKDPIITVRLLNFKITVIGEVNKPSTFVVPTGRINILEALGLAGDMTAYGRRENVLLVRERNGIRSTTRLNLNNKELLNSPNFYLQQNDVVYVVPDRLKEVQASTNTRTITIATMAISVLVALIFNFQNIF
ncbi:sugar transporter [Hymenobacter sp. HMF4947]|uniref:Sugar transporter n=1 Tax=Hymenobacter ginkgonis TaxID=2682976 RepID=A0A7K1TFS3_9BACT|nr:sugar transporter [Hymenobacter ginkgonis]